MTKYANKFAQLKKKLYLCPVKCAINFLFNYKF